MEVIAVSNNIIKLLRLLHICVEMEHTTSVENKPGINGKKSY
jgi:hypothetical protein